MLQQGEHEHLKASVHATLAIFAATCAVYNASAWFVRPSRHLWVNAVLYSTMTIWEINHIRHHLLDKH